MHALKIFCFLIWLKFVSLNKIKLFPASLGQAQKSMNDKLWLLILQPWGRQIIEEQRCFWWTRVGVRPGHFLGLLSLQQPSCCLHPTPFICSGWEEALARVYAEKIMTQEQLLIPMSRTGHSHHSWRIPCLRTRVGEQWDHFLFYSPCSSYGLFFCGWGRGALSHLGRMEKTPLDGAHSITGT